MDDDEEIIYIVCGVVVDLDDVLFLGNCVMQLEYDEYDLLLNGVLIIEFVVVVVVVIMVI